MFLRPPNAGWTASGVVRNGVLAKVQGQDIGGAGDIHILHDDGVLELPEHQHAAVQGVLPGRRVRGTTGH